MGNRSGAQNGEANLNQLVMPRSVELETEVSAVKENGRMLQGPGVREALPVHALQDGRCSERPLASSLDAGPGEAPVLQSLLVLSVSVGDSSLDSTQLAPPRRQREAGPRIREQCHLLQEKINCLCLFPLRACCVYYGDLAGSVPPWAAELLPQKPAKPASAY